MGQCTSSSAHSASATVAPESTSSSQPPHPSPSPQASRCLLTEDALCISAYAGYAEELKPLPFLSASFYQEESLLLATKHTLYGAKHRTRLLSLCWKGDVDRVVFLLRAGVSVGDAARDMDENTPLVLAAENGHKRVCEALMRVGKADVNAPSGRERMSALHLAAYWESDSMCRLLIELGADVNARDGHGQIPFMHGALHRRDSICKLFLEHNADVNAGNAFNIEMSPLLWACWAGMWSLSTYLISQGADVNAKGGFDWLDAQTPLCYAILAGREDICRLLVRSGASLQVRDNNGRTPLLFAEKSQSAEMHALLIELGADVADKGDEALIEAAELQERELQMELDALPMNE